MKLRAFLPLASLSVASVAALAAPASAQEAAAPPVPTNPGLFPTMGPDGTGSTVGAQLTLLTGDGDTVRRLDLQGQFVGANGVGGYAAIGGSQIDDADRLGSLEVGALFRTRGLNTDLTVRAGLILPTSSDDELDGFEEAFLHLISTALARPADLLTAAPDTTTLRLSATPQIRNGFVVARADVGLDIVIDTEGENPDMPFMHVDLGVGYDNGKMSAVFELSSFMDLDEPGDMMHVAAVTAAAHVGQATPYVSLARPFGDFFGEDDDDLDVTNFILGVRGRL